MIIWITKKAASMPVNQRAKILTTDSEKDTLIVRLQGTGELREIDASDICGVEITDNISVFFDKHSVRKRN